MTTLTFPIPENINGDRLTADLAGAGFADVDVAITGDALTIAGLPDDVDEHAVAAAVASHDPTPLPSPLDRLGVAYTYDVVIGFRTLADAAGALCLPEQALIDEATAWTLAE